jgi:predicted RND superfamily exporter protein
MKRIILFAYSLYIFYAFYGCFHLEIGMEPRQLLASDSPAGKALEIAETHFAGFTSLLSLWSLIRFKNKA